MVSQRFDHQVALTPINNTNAEFAGSTIYQSGIDVLHLQASLALSVGGRLLANSDSSLQTAINVRYRQSRPFDRKD